MGLGRKPHNVDARLIVSSTVVTNSLLGHRWEAKVRPPAFSFVNAMTSSTMVSGI